MKNISFLLCFIFSLLFISSCTIRKRTVNKGYFVQWYWDKKIRSTSVSIENLPEITPETAFVGKDEMPVLAEEQVLQEENFTARQDNIEKTESINLIKTTRQIVRKIVPGKITLQKKVFRPLQLKSTNKAPMPMDLELTINIVLTVIFLGLAILFTILAIHAAAGTMLYVWAGLAGLCFIIFITQIIDLILW